MVRVALMPKINKLENELNNGEPITPWNQWYVIASSWQLAQLMHNQKLTTEEHKLVVSSKCQHGLLEL